jgi:hypothetical protein
MPAPRDLSAVTCSCGWRTGDIRLIDSTDWERAEAEMHTLRDKVPTMVRHWRLRHDLTVNPRAPLAVKALIAKAARELADDASPATEETGMVRR